ncbi:MAG: iron-sulfur cluster-binding domain-containing protein [Ferruginibacter sp.]
MQQLRITRIITETNDAKTFVLQPFNGDELVYKAGQFLTLVFQTPFGEKRRSYSFSSSPVINELPAITIKKVENGEFSRILLDHTAEGEILYTSGISGFFQLPEDPGNTEQFFFLAAGSGITPCFSLVKTLLTSTDKPVVLIYSNRQKADTIFYNQLLTLKQQYPQQFIIRFLFSNTPDVYNSRLSNWLLQQLLMQYLTTEKSKAVFYLCGPFEYMRTISITLLNEGVPLQNIRKENFSSLPRIIKPEPPDKNLHAVTIHFQNKVQHIDVQYPNTILAAAKTAHIDIPFSCEAGRCGSCAATCIKGKVWMAYNEVLMDDEIAKGRILCCQAYPVGGDVEIVV